MVGDNTTATGVSVGQQGCQRRGPTGLLILGMRLHQAATGLLVGGIKTSDGSRDLFPRLAGGFGRRQARFETAHQPFLDGLALGQHPDAEGRIEIVEALQQRFVEMGRVEQQGVNAPIFRLPQDALDIDLDQLMIEADGETAGVEAGKPGIFRIEHADVESGLHEGVQHLSPGDSAVLVIPSALAFGLLGDRGKIPMRSTVVYHIGLVAVEE